MVSRSRWLLRTKKLLLKFLFSKPCMYLTGTIRPRIVLRLVRRLHFVSSLNILIELFDPNQIRRRVEISLAKCHIETELSNVSGTYILDINDHLGYRVYVTNKVDQDIILIGKALDFSNQDIFLDIGANTGLVCIPFAVHFDCEVIAVEASKSNAALLLQNAFINQVKLHPHVVCWTDVPLSLQKPWIEIYGRNGNSGATSVFSGWNPSIGQVRESILSELSPASTLDALIPEQMLNRISLIKIDVEGSEEMVLSGFKKVAQVKAPIIFEYRIDLNAKFLHSQEIGFIKQLEPHFKLYSYKEVQGKILLFDFDISRPQENAIGFPRENLQGYLSKFL